MTATASQTSLDEATAMLRGVLAVFTEPGALAALGDQELLALMREVEQLGRSIDGVRVLAAGEIADRSRPELGPERLSTRLGCRTPTEVIERTTLVSSRTARTRVRLAERIRPAVTLTGELLPGAFPSVRAALADGTLSTDTAAAIVDELAPVLDRGSVIDAIEGIDGVHAAEHELVAAAQAGEPCDDVRMMAQTWALFLDPDGALPDEERAQRKRGLHLGRERDGVVPFTGALLPEVAAQLQLLLDAYTNPKAGEGPRFIPDAGGAADEAGGSAPGPSADGGGSGAVDDGGDAGESGDNDPLMHDDPERRTPAQKRHDAFAGILNVSAGADGHPRLGGAAPTLVVAITPDQLDEPRGVAFLQGGAQDGAAVSASVARQTACAGAVQRLVLHRSGRIIELGGRQRIFTAHQRRAIMIRDGECVIPGCHVPATWCEIHHVTEHSQGGPTHTSNGAALCWHHHRTIDIGGWTIEMRRGVPWIRPPGWIDPTRTWQPGGRSAFRAWATMRASPDPTTHP